ncbi:OLC1v1010580C1 [Oldenlandia corymbosa var. corymbosa]|uniref:Phosphotransferase n=1 Tax=Oldenlandia corymbosa var. corymbosa TaxID=529605 RepID=A0AAV1DV12_OLDCO|nr:OLC1v1010580C1 [Oldenlandia corymbosa var. corymbosa]
MQELFDFIALELSKFISMHDDNSGVAKLEKVKLGFTISAPVDQDVASACKAIDWKKLNDHTVREQLTTEINHALTTHSVDMQVSAVVDEVVGDLAGGRYYSRDSVAAISMGMGIDVAYTEIAQEAQKLQTESANSVEMVVNMQLRDFSSVNLPLTEFDATMDLESTNPGVRVFEKLVSGMYLGEIVRKVLLKMAQETALFGDIVPTKLITPYILRSPDLAAMHQDTSEDYKVVDEKLKEIFEIANTTPMVREVVAEICDIVAERGARLVGATMVGLVKKLGRIANRKSVITVEGGLYEHYRIFRNYLHSSVWEMLGSELSDNVIIEHSHGGSGAGALFLAASHTHNAHS